LEIREACGGCTHYGKSCVVSVSGSTISLRLEGVSCAVDPGLACPAVCSENKFSCSVPPLAAGSYTVEAQGTAPRALVVSDSATETSCEVSAPGYGSCEETLPTSASTCSGQISFKRYDCPPGGRGALCGATVLYACGLFASDGGADDAGNHDASTDGAAADSGADAGAGVGDAGGPSAARCRELCAPLGSSLDTSKCVIRPGTSGAGVEVICGYPCGA
jgi:hypothetical protein